MGGKIDYLVKFGTAGMGHVLLFTTINGTAFGQTLMWNMIRGVYNNKILGWVFKFLFMVSENYILST